MAMNNGYDDKEKLLDSLSTTDKIKYRRLEAQYESERQSGEQLPEKREYILSQLFKKDLRKGR